MNENELIICGLTETEKKEIQEHQGECNHCQNYYDTFDNTGELLPCSKGHPIGQETCEDWTLDMR